MNTIYAIHGFLGKTSDFDIFSDLNLTPIDPFFYHAESLEDFAAKLNASIISNHDSILLGYSMGGRLALHTLINCPKKWKAAIIISSHTGLKSSLEKQERLKKDLCLIKRFEQENFEHMMNEWNNQDLFDPALPLNRKKEDYTSEILKKSLVNFSLGTQEDLKTKIAKLEIPILWIVGEKDKKYLELALNLKFLHPKSRIWIASNAFHRVPWSLKKEFEQQVKIFIEGL